MNLPGNAVFRWVAGALRGKGSEQAIPDNQCATVVAVNAFRVTTMVNAVVAGGVEKKLDPGRQAPHQGGVHEKLVHQGESIGDADPHRVESDQRHGQIENPHAVENVGGILAHGGGEIHAFGRMMDYMGGPEPAHAVAGTVHPVETEIHAEKGQKSGRPVQLQFQQAIVIAERVDGKGDQAGKK